MRLWIVIGAVSAFVSVAAGAFGAHALKARLTPDMLTIFETGNRYQMYHSLGLLAVGLLAASRPSGLLNGAGWAMLVGILGAGLGPTVTGALSDRFAASHFGGGDFFVRCPGGRGGDGMGTALDVACIAASGDGLRLALICTLAAFAWAALHYWLAARTLRDDLYRPAA